MRRRLILSALLLTLVAPAAAQERGIVARMGACQSTAPRLWLAVDGASSSDCASGGGSSQVLCLCSGGSWAAVGSGGGGGGTDTTSLVGSSQLGYGQPLLFACEFNGSDCGATVNYGSVTLDTTNTTVRPWTQAATNKITADYTSWPGWLLMQHHSTATFNCVTWEWTIPTSDTTYTVVARAFGFPWSNWDQLRPENNESSFGVSLLNASDANESVTFWICESDANGCDWQFDLYNNGSLTYYQHAANTGGFGAGLHTIWRNGNDYTAQVVGVTGTYLNIGRGTNTGETTFNRLRMTECSSNNPLTPIHGIDYLRIYADLLVPPPASGTDTGP